MTKERDSGDLDGTSQSKRPLLNRLESSDQTHHLSHQHPRPKSQKHLVGGGTGGRLHARVPSSKALHKHHAATSTAKLNRRRSLSPDQATGPPLPPTHRRATSDLKLGNDASVSSHIRKNSSHTSLKYNRSHVDASKKSKLSTNLKRSQSNPAVHKLKGGASKVHFNLGGDGPDDFEDENGDGPEDEWVDASTSASPLLSRRSSAAAGAQTQGAFPSDGPLIVSPTTVALKAAELVAANHTRELSQSSGLSQSSHNQYLTTRILQRAPSHGAPPKMTAENASARPGSSRQHSPDSIIGADPSSLGTSRMVSQSRPGSSGKQELTSRFVGINSQESGSGVPVNHFMTSIQHGGISRAAVTGRLEANGPRRPRSMGNLSQVAHRHGANGDYDYAGVMDSTKVDEPLTDEEDVENNRLAAGPRSRRNGGYTHPTADMSRTQQKLNLQRASSTLEPTHPHPGLGMGLGGVAVAPGPLVGGSTYDSRDPRLGKLLERTGMGYLIVRRYQNPIARSLARLAQLPGADKNRPIPRPGTGHSKRGLDVNGRPASAREREPRDANMATLIGGQSARRPATPRGAFSLRQPASTSSSLETDDGASRIHERSRLSGTSLVNGEDEATTLTLLRNMWDKNLDLSASQE